MSGSGSLADEGLRAGWVVALMGSARATGAPHSYFVARQDSVPSGSSELPLWGRRFLKSARGDGMFFEKRRWALRLTDSMGLPPSSREATEIVELVLYGAKILGQMRANKLTNPQKVVLAAMRVSIDESAREVLAERLIVTTTAAWNLQMRLKAAAERMAKLAGLPDDEVGRP